MNVKQQATIYLDLDGVFTNFVKRAEEIYPDFHNICGVYHDMISTDRQRVWRNDMIKAVINTPDFWSNLEWINGGKELFSFVKDNFDTVCVLTAPIDEDMPRCSSQKRKWVSNNFGENFIPIDRMFISHDKYEYVGAVKSNNYQILIDDRIDNIQKWIDNGGIGLLHDSNDYRRTIEQLRDYII